MVLNKNQSLLSMIEGKPKFSVLSQILRANEIDIVIKAEGKTPFTFLAPINAAFEILSPSLYDKLFKKEGKQVVFAIIEQHLLPGINPKYEEMENFNSVGTFFGNKLRIKKNGKKLFVDSAELMDSGIKPTPGMNVIAVNRLLPVRKAAIRNKRYGH